MFTHQVRVENQSRFQWGKRFVDFVNIMYVYTVGVSLFFIDIYMFLFQSFWEGLLSGAILVSGGYGYVWYLQLLGVIQNNGLFTPHDDTLENDESPKYPAENEPKSPKKGPSQKEMNNFPTNHWNFL